MALWMLMMTLAGLSADDALVREHLQEAEATLRARDTSHLTPALRAERTRNLDRLRAYWQRGAFPRNTDFANERVPYFIDDAGTTCAMAHLVIESGHEVAARKIAGRENNARIRQMQSPELAAWLASSGLTLEEAALIQPGYEPPKKVYCGCPCEYAPVHTFRVSDAGQGRETTYVNACVASLCNDVPSRAILQGCGPKVERIVTRSESRWGGQPVDMCWDRFASEYQVVYNDYELANAAFLEDVCAGEEASVACQVARTSGAGVPWALLAMIGVVGVGRRRRVA